MPIWRRSGRDVLNSWKIEVLSDLHFRAAATVRGGGRHGTRDRSRESNATPCRELLTHSRASDAWFERQLAALPEAFVGKQPPAEVADALRRLRTLEPRAGMAWANYLKDTDTVEFIAGIDQGAGRAIFSSMAGALTSQKHADSGGRDRHAGRRSDAAAVRRFRAGVAGRAVAARLRRICRALVASIDSEETPRFPKILGREQKEAGAALTNMPNEVRIDNEMSDRCTVIEVFTVDRRGLLYRLARALHDLGLVIRFAKIGTYLDQVVDVFYVTDRDGAKGGGRGTVRGDSWGTDWL